MRGPALITLTQKKMAQHQFPVAASAKRHGSIGCMSKFDSFVAAFEDGKRQICINLLRDYPQITLAEVHAAGGELGKLLGSLTVGELLGQTKVKAPAPPPKAKAKTKAKAAKPGRKAAAPAPAAPAPVADADEPAGGEINTRTPSGRASLDHTVFEVLKSMPGWVGAGELQKQIGGTNMQIRNAVNRLIDQGKVTWTGKARGTRYRVS